MLKYLFERGDIMNFIEKTITLEKYILIKNWAYNSVEYFRTLSLKDKYIFIKSLQIKDKNILDIFLSTLFLPNDLELITLFSNNKDVNGIAKKFNVPFNLIIKKKLELREINLIELINEGKISKESAMQKPIDLNEKDDIDDLLLAVFPDQPYIAYTEKQNELIKQKILELLKK